MITKTNWTTDEYLNYGDINRIESNVDEILTKIAEFQTPISVVSVTSRTRASIDYATSFNRLETNILNIKNSIYTPDGWITPVVSWVSGNSLNYVDVNRWESNILGLYTLAYNISDYLMLCGNYNAICGETNDFV